jgi:hypothetical protein
VELNEARLATPSASMSTTVLNGHLRMAAGHCKIMADQRHTERGLVVASYVRLREAIRAAARDLEGLK